MHGLFDLKTLEFLSKLKATHSFAHRPLILKLQQQVFKFNICMSSSSTETDQVTNFLNLKNRGFDSVSFSQ